ncbi:FAD-binding and (Fe-S)-binding domain-containing protein [Neolewinella agarilytica]|uniref:FAD/FMN-containing dehydrogenase n=1 Tax=Neolewinella agarilytica TaxID=478744 RepID=A0A1H9I2W1_9BACT|nr:FAD-binding and (Fe-S)-binding domain-containing protein [Neolewinella agarilytica]SEQ68868.1 FAD/FMN-containing dehydrogenase [Neolewinella agarilytica]
MSSPISKNPPWQNLAESIQGELHLDEAHRILYATDASVYRQRPLGVVFPRSEEDIAACVRFAGENALSITPRAGGTSLAGQAIGGGLVIDVSRYLTRILEINTAEGYAIVEPGVIRDQLNGALAPLGYWFGPNTSTANRCTLGGMFGNNSCGSTSITVGSTREHVLEARAVLADGSVHDFGALQQGAQTQVQGEVTEQSETLRAVYQFLETTLKDPNRRQQIVKAFPKAAVSRRNTGYALDLLARQAPFTPGGPAFNLCTLLAGSEGTLAFTTRLKVRILPLPPAGTAVAAVHFSSINGAMRATQAAMRHQPFMCELMDDTILRLARTNPDQAKNANFVQGDPRAILLVEFRANTDAEALRLAKVMEEDLDTVQELQGSLITTGYVSGARNVAKAWALRSAGLGILGNMVGDAKAVACIEDTAVALPDLADYIDDVAELMKFYGQNAIYYAHAGAGEIHLRPVLNLKTTKGRQDFYAITRDVARLVKKYGGSLSGEHGDGRVRAPFLPEMLGPEVYQLLLELKRAWDPAGIFNPGKIVEAPPMNEDLRYEADVATPDYPTLLDFSADGGLLPAIEKCNGSGDCRKLSGGAMCPSYRALRSEQHSTRGRANTLREVLTRNQHDDPFAHPALQEALDLCLSCKACTSECPSSVDMTNLKAEYLHQKGKTSLRTRLIAANETLYTLGGKVPRLANFGLKLFSPVLKKVAGIAPARSLPAFPKKSLRGWFNDQTRNAMRSTNPLSSGEGLGRGVYLFGDEFTNLQDVHVGQATVTLLERLGYRVQWPEHATSGRAQLSKGLLPAARQRAKANVALFSGLVSEEAPLVGIEPSAILGFRDEYPKLLRGELAAKAKELARNVYTLDEFLFREFSAGQLGPEDFGPEAVDLVLHVHCHEKALGDAGKCAAALSLPTNFNVRLLDSGCCGMAGSFGYEAEHYELSKTIAEQSLLRHLRELPPETVVVASGTSCRHQVKDLLGVKAVSTAEGLLRSWG